MSAPHHIEERMGINYVQHLSVVCMYAQSLPTHTHAPPQWYNVTSALTCCRPVTAWKLKCRPVGCISALRSLKFIVPCESHFWADLCRAYWLCRHNGHLPPWRRFMTANMHSVCLYLSSWGCSFAYRLWTTFGVWTTLSSTLGIFKNSLHCRRLYLQKQKQNKAIPHY